VSRCRCGKQHRSYWTLAKCLWPRAIWDGGNGPYALLAHCDVLTVSLHKTLESALDSKRQIDWTACGGRCRRDHEIVRIGVA
jgi:hypothetical protein